MSAGEAGAAGAARGRHDEVLGAILLEQNSIIGFLSTVFDFLARRTDFYYVPDGPYENIGFPPGVAEELTVKVLRNCDPNRPKNTTQCTPKSTNLNDDIMCSTVAQEVEIETDDDQIEEIEAVLDNPPLATAKDDSNSNETQVENTATPMVSSPEKTVSPSPQSENKQSVSEPGSAFCEPPKIPVQKDSDSYNGAVRETYSWSQNIMELEVTVKLPPDVKSSKDLRVTIAATDLCIECLKSKEVIIKDKFTYKVKPLDCYWTISGGRLIIHLEKVQERWWAGLLSSEAPIDLSKIDCSRPMDELPEDQVAKIHELQWNHERKLKGLPTSDEMKNIEILRKAWDKDGSPFRGKPFDPSVLHS